MQAAVERVASFLLSVRARNRTRIRSAVVIALVIGALLWQTRWPSLQPGLALLLFGQLAVALLLWFRNTRLANGLERLRQRTDPVQLLSWFDMEAVEIKQLSLVENGMRAAGFLLLAWGFWTATRNLWISVALGLFYPVAAYFGLARRSDRTARERLFNEREEVQAILRGAEASSPPRNVP